MSYSIKWHPKTKKFLHKLPQNISARIVRKVKYVKDNPFYYLEHYEGENYYKLRVGNYRLLIDVDHKKKILFIRMIGHRKNIYKNV